MRGALFSAIAILFVCLNSSVAQTAKCSLAGLPKGISDDIQIKFSGWRPEQISDLIADDQELWTKAHGDLCPGITSGDFEGASQTTYAVLLLPEDRSLREYKFLLFEQSRAGAFTSILLARAEGENGGQPVISRVPPGHYSDPETGKSVKTKFDSVLLEWIEAAARLYYWTGSKYQILQVQD